MERLVEVRQTYVTAAEAAVREAEGIVRYFEDEAAQNARQIRQTREEIGSLQSFTGSDMQARERFISGLQVRAKQITQEIDKARQELEKRRLAWRETMRARKVVERVQDRRQQEWTRSVDVMEQKQVDEMSVGRHARDKSSASTKYGVQ